MALRFVRFVCAAAGLAAVSWAARLAAGFPQEALTVVDLLVTAGLWAAFFCLLWPAPWAGAGLVLHSELAHALQAVQAPWPDGLAWMSALACAAALA